MITAKAVAAGVGSTAAAVVTFAAVLGTALDDGRLDAGEYGILTTALVVAASTIYAVWKTPNKPKDSA
jgi:hypothetical protein